MSFLSKLKDRLLVNKPAPTPEPNVEKKLTPLQKYLKPSRSKCHHNLSLGLVNEMLAKMFFSGHLIASLSKDLLRSLFFKFGHEWFLDNEGNTTGCSAYIPFDTRQLFKIKESTEHGGKSIGSRIYLVDHHRQLFNSRQNEYTDGGLVKEYHVFAVIVLAKEVAKREEYTFPVIKRRYFTVMSYAHSSKEFLYEEISLGEFEDMLLLEDEAS